MKYWGMIVVNNKCAVVTGGSSGIGLAVCHKFLTNGYVVYNLDLKKNNDKKINTIICDVSQEDQVIRAVDEIKKHNSEIEVLVNCAGIFCDKVRGEIFSIPIEEWNKVINVNLTGVFLVSKYFVPLLMKSKHDVSIINISSDQAIYQKAGGGPYGISKAAVSALTKTLAKDLVKYGIRVNEVAAASVRTNFINKYFNERNMDVDEIYNKMAQQMPFGLIEPSAIANAVYWLSSEDAKNITGQTLFIDSGYLL